MRSPSTTTPFALQAGVLLAVAACTGCSTTETDTTPLVPTEPFEIKIGKPVPDLPGEPFFRNVRQLTFGGENAEAYWSGDGTKLIFQTRGGPYECDQIEILDLRTGKKQLVSTGKGRTTCSYFLQGDDRIIYSSTHLGNADCPPPVVRVRGGKYVWPVYKTYDIFTAKLDGSDIQRITRYPGYDAEATVCRITGRVLFTSVRDGDLELYSMEPDGTDIQRLTNRPGYDGGGFYSHDGTKIVQRSGFLKTEQQRKEYFDLLKRGLVEPNKIEITVIDREGGNFRQVTNNGKANFAPYWHPDNQRIIFSSSVNSKGRRPTFNLYLIHEDGSGLTKVSNDKTFDSFPMFSPDGRYLVFASNRHNGGTRDTNLFVAEWIEPETDK